MDINIDLIFTIINSICTIVGTVITFASLCYAIYTANKARLQNEKQLAENLKPDIQVYIDYLASAMDCIFVVKNFGKSGTTIKNFKVTPDTDALAIKIIKEAFKESTSVYIAPGQAIMIPLPQIKELKKETTKIDVSFTYNYNNTGYQKSFSLDLSYTNMWGTTKIRTVEEGLQKISDALWRLISK